MKPETAEWLDKAEGDWKVAQREMQAPDPVWNVVCFLAEQCAEKYLEPLKPQLAHLSTFGIAARYPGVQADRYAAESAMRIGEEVRTAVRSSLGLQ